jgi:hypothetical protein
MDTDVYRQTDRKQKEQNKNTEDRQTTNNCPSSEWDQCPAALSTQKGLWSFETIAGCRCANAFLVASQAMAHVSFDFLLDIFVDSYLKLNRSHKTNIQKVIQLEVCVN